MVFLYNICFCDKILDKTGTHIALFINIRMGVAET